MKSSKNIMLIKSVTVLFQNISFEGNILLLKDFDADCIEAERKSVERPAKQRPMSKVHKIVIQSIFGATRARHIEEAQEQENNHEDDAVSQVGLGDMGLDREILPLKS